MTRMVDIIKLSVSDDIVAEAKKYAAYLGSLPGSIKHGDGNVVGFIGKKIVANYLGTELTVDNYNYNFTYRGMKATVHSKKRRGNPEPHFDCSVTDSPGAINGNFDIFIFAQVSNDMKTAWILGYYGKDKYFEDAKKLKAGDVDPSNNYVVRESCYNMPISMLEPIEKDPFHIEKTDGDQLPIVW